MSKVGPSAAVPLSDADRRVLILWIRAGRTPQRVAKRARVVLLAAEGLSTRATARRLNVSPRTVVMWRRRFQHHGPESLWRDAPGRGRKPSIGVDAVSRVRTTLQTTPPRGSRWSIRVLAQVTGLSRASVHRIVRRLNEA
jgi:hypothetical protein